MSVFWLGADGRATGLRVSEPSVSPLFQVRYFLLGFLNGPSPSIARALRVRFILFSILRSFKCPMLTGLVFGC